MSRRNQSQPNFAHDLVNKLSVIVGHCDLMIQDLPADSKHRQRLRLVRDVANSLADQIKTRQRNLAVTMEAHGNKRHVIGLDGPLA